MSGTDDSNFLGQSPNFWSNLANFGGNLSVAANARGPMGELKYGGGLGALGPAVLANQEWQQKQPFMRAELEKANLQNQGLGLQNQVAAAQLPYAQALAKAQIASLPGGQQQTSVPLPFGGQATPAAPFADRLGQVESSNNYSAMNNLGFAGKYQLGAADLADAGVYKPAPGEDLSKNQWKGTFNIAPYKPMTIGDWLQNPQAQDAAFRAHASNLETQAKTMGLDQYEGQTIGGMPMTHEAILAGMHLAGPTGMANWLKSGGKNSPADENGTTIPAYIGRVAPSQSVLQNGIDQGAMAQAQQHYARANQFAFVNPELAKVELEQAGKYFDLATAGQKAAATAGAEAAASWQKPVVTRAGVYDPRTNKEIYRQPEYHEFTDPVTGQERGGFIAPNDQGGVAVTGGFTPGSEGPVVKMAPGQEETIKHLSDQYANENKAKYEGAINSLFQLEQQDQNIATLNSGGGWSVTGAGNNFRLGLAKQVNGLLTPLGIAPAVDPTKVASWEDANKLQTQLAFAQARQLGSREAAQIIHMSAAATPGTENTPQGYKLISGGYREMNQREVDLRNFETNWMQQRQGNLIGAETAFNTQYTPKMYADRAISQVHPIRVNTPGAVKNMLPGTMFVGPDGIPRVVPGGAGASGQ